jgi:hypothetical protein
MSATKQQRLAKRMRLAARVIGVVITTFFLLFLIGETITSIQAEGFKFDAESLFVVVPAVIALAGYIVSWWRERVGGSLLILVSIAFGILPSVGAQQHQVPWSMLQALQGWLILGSPFLVAGVLFLLSWWLTRKASLQE